MTRKLRQVGGWLVHQANSFLGHAVGVVVFMTLWTSVKAFRDDNKFSYYLEHPGELLSPALVSILTMLALGLIALALKQKRTLSSFGVRLFSRHDSDAAKKADWDALRADIAQASEEKATLWMLGATGKETFSGGASPLRDCIMSYEGPIRVLLIRPNSAAFNDRCNSLGVAQPKYLRDILDSIDFCHDLVTGMNRELELRLYEGMPIWKMFMTNRVLWVQFYKPGVHVDATPMYSFELRTEGMSLFDGFRSVLKKRWDHDGSTAVDMTAYTRSEWARHC